MVGQVGRYLVEDCEFHRLVGDNQVNQRWSLIKIGSDRTNGLKSVLVKAGNKSAGATAS